MITKHYAAGDIITKEGDISDFAYYITSGTVEVLVDKQGKDMLIAEQEAGDFFGEMGIILEEPRSATIRARTDVELEAYDIQSFEENIINHTERRNAYLPNLFERIRLLSSMLRTSILPDDAADSSLQLESCDVHGLVEARQVHELEATTSQTATSTPSVSFKSVECLKDAKQPVDLKISKFPYNIGRASSSKILVENDFYLDDSKPHTVSRGHCSIEKRDGVFIVRDRFSACGTTLNGELLGKATKKFIGKLKSGKNELILGDQHSNYRFIIEISE